MRTLSLQYTSIQEDGANEILNGIFDKWGPRGGNCGQMRKSSWRALVYVFLIFRKVKKKQGRKFVEECWVVDKDSYGNLDGLNLASFKA